MPSETSKYRALTTPHIPPGSNVLDVGSQGDPVVPWAIQVELPTAEYAHYTGGKTLDQAGVWRGDGRALPFRSNTLDVLYSSHLLEDFNPWFPVIAEWYRVIKPGGTLIILTPDNALWDAAIARGQTPNCAHRHCGAPGELTRTLHNVDQRALVLEDRLTRCFPGDYTILFVAKKPDPLPLA